MTGRLSSDLTDLADAARKQLGAEVVSMEQREGETGSILELRLPSTTLGIPAPWTFASCLLASSSDAIDPDEEIESLLVGLKGARLTAVETGDRSVDLVFDSIRLSVFSGDRAS